MRTEIWMKKGAYLHALCPNYLLNEFLLRMMNFSIQYMKKDPITPITTRPGQMGAYIRTIMNRTTVTEYLYSISTASLV